MIGEIEVGHVIDIYEHVCTKVESTVSTFADKIDPHID
jgi:hypothetical protein